MKLYPGSTVPFGDKKKQDKLVLAAEDGALVRYLMSYYEAKHKGLHLAWRFVNRLNEALSKR